MASAELELSAAERDLAASLHAMSEPALVTRADLASPGPTIIAASPAFCSQTGYAAAELIGQNPRIFQGPLTDRTVLDRLRRQCEEGERFVGEAVNYRKDGSTYIVEWAIAPVRDDAGRVSHFMSLQRDVTAARAFAREWLEADARARSALEQANASMAAIAEAILVLEKTKRSFHSKELGALRERLLAASRQHRG